MVLHGISWDHARGVHPLLAVSREYHKKHPDVEIVWDKRSLTDFEDYPIEKLTPDYDFIMIDHPFMSSCLEKHLLADLSKLLSHECMQSLNSQNIGPGLESYYVGNVLQAVPVDAAAQVCAYRPDYFEKTGLEIPSDLDGVFRLVKDLEPGKYIGACMAPTHIFSMFMGFVAQQCGRDYISFGKGVDVDAGVCAADAIKRIKAAALPQSYAMGPIKTLDEMSENDSIVYTPYVYGYINYSESGFRKNLVRFSDAPLFSRAGGVSTQIGGVGICIASRLGGKELEEAVRFVEYLVSPAVQAGIYTENDGQPAAKCAWESDYNNELTHGFFKDTFATLDMSFLRPKHVRYNDFQAAAGKRLHNDILNDLPSIEAVSHFNELFREICRPDSK